MSSPPLMAITNDPALTLDKLLAFVHTPMAKLEHVCNALTSDIDQTRFNSLLARIQKVSDSIRPQNSPKRKGEWEAQRSRLKGALFEELIGIVLSSAVIFDSYQHLQTITNEIDWLVVLGPFTFLVRPLDSWGPHFVCECKMTKKALDTNWVSRLNTLLQTQNAPVAVLFTAAEVGNKGNSARTLRLIEDLAIHGANPRFIIRITMEELLLCVSRQRNLLHFISERFLQLKVRSDKLKLIYG